MKNTYKSLKEFSKSFNHTDCFKMRFMKRDGGYVFNTIVNDENVKIVVSFSNKDKEPVIFTGKNTRRILQSFQVEYTHFNMFPKKVEKVLVV